jgi:osmotically-inducible protein OsmY
MKKYLIYSVAAAVIAAACIPQVGCVINAHDNCNGSDEVISDSAITAAIKGKYIADPNIKSLNIHVKTNNGHVTLTGIVPNIAMKNLAVSLAQNTDGVTKVHSKLIVKK